MNNWKLVTGIGLLGGFVGVPIVRTVMFVASVSGWRYALEGVVVSLLWAGAVVTGIWLLILGVAEWQERRGQGK